MEIEYENLSKNLKIQVLDQVKYLYLLSEINILKKSSIKQVKAYPEEGNKNFKKKKYDAFQPK